MTPLAERAMQEVVPNLFISGLMGARPEHVKDMRIGLVVNATGISASYGGHVRVVNVDVKDDPTADIHSHFKVTIPKNRPCLLIDTFCQFIPLLSLSLYYVFTIP